ncbi:hypothetical protein BMT55_09230 [Listeria newyorkensis]|uniref:DUF72 domain-containing protein n=1 Tax=Listeria newyorkensis TaxID=1497681 RepID=A0ABX4XLH0_9LIST|nr:MULTISPECIES: DUF72 domain-containing protein [Listeria]KGL46728.1 hypothetical protein EP56_00930 [Listeriaceae bacterium FSL A5-0209]KGL37484.1 hypothetical protein EP58_17160 [Listeria newyorkensis]PNP92142.1 hypothetical protein BMT55_09230 [Listeria newyorkensis]RQW65943.1 DUF72 domain-containing protein [Listeria sp. SHR_NRA_18]WAO20289.1 DUF72 domain-containing protein [Listeria newyorkensis]
MITIGLTGWSDHATLYSSTSKHKLEDYAGNFPMVEVDTSFYAIPSPLTTERWIERTPEEFTFVVKAFQAMTKHKEWQQYYDSETEMYRRFMDAIAPMSESGRLKAILFQFPPYFGCTKENVTYLRAVREKMGDLPLAIEFRNKTWYTETNEPQTLALLKDLGFIHTVVDEPQVGNGSVPIVLRATNEAMTLVRLHGRNSAGWMKANSPEWREVRTLYRYNDEEINYWAENIRHLQKHSKEVIVIFNNNSGGDAADNAKQLQKALDISYEGLAPMQMNLFDI